MADYDVEIPDEEKVAIASDFILNAPPGEFNEVFNDVRVLLNNDGLLKEGAASAFTQYNEEQYTAVKVEGAETLITPHGRLDGGRYFDPRSHKSFKFDHVRKEASDIQDEPADDSTEATREAFQTAAFDYLAEHYPSGVAAVYAKGSKVIICIEDHKFQPNNFWNGRWRSEWTYDTKSGAATGVLRVQVHYYEDGNVQLQSNKEVSLKVPFKDAKATAGSLMSKVSEAENEYQSAISENYNAMSDTTFKALRRALPITRSKVNWNQILNYKVGKELSNK